LEAVKQWVYQPTLLNGEPVEVVTQIDVNFHVESVTGPDPEGTPGRPEFEFNSQEREKTMLQLQVWSLYLLQGGTVGGMSVP